MPAEVRTGDSHVPHPCCGEASQTHRPSREGATAHPSQVPRPMSGPMPSPQGGPDSTQWSPRGSRPATRHCELSSLIRTAEPFSFMTTEKLAIVGITLEHRL